MSRPADGDVNVENVERRDAAATLAGNRSFGYLWLGQGISQLGSQVTLVALPLLAVVTLDGTPVEVTAVVAAEYLPSLLFGLLGGALVDRADQRRVMLVTDLVRALALLVIPLAAWIDVLSFPLVYVVAFVIGTATLFFDLAYQSALPRIVGPGLLLDANGRLETARSVSTAVGPPIGSLLVQLLTAPVAVIVDAVSFIASWAATLPIRLHAAPPADVPPGPAVGRLRGSVRSLRADLRAGLSFVWHDRRQVAVIGVAATANTATVVAVSLLPLWLRNALHLPVWCLGVVLGCGAVGAVVAGFVLARLKPLDAPWRRMAVTLVIAGLGLALVPAAGGPAVLEVVTLCVAMAVLQGCLVVVAVNGMSWRQRVTPPHMLAKAIAAARTVNYGILPLGSLAGGALASSRGLRPVLFGTAVLLVASPLWFLVLRGPAGPATGPTGSPS